MILLPSFGSIPRTAPIGTYRDDVDVADINDVVILMDFYHLNVKKP